MTTFELGNRVTVVNAPGRPSMQEQELPHLLHAEGAIHDMREVGGNVRIVVDFDNGTRYWFYEDELKHANGVQNLTADVPVYEAAADVAAYLEHDAFTSHAAEEAPFAWNASVQPELTVLDAPDSVEWIEQDDFVRIERLVRRDDAPAEYGTVLRVNAAVQYALVQFEGMDKSEWFSIEEVYLVSKAGALETAGAVASA